MTILGLDIGSKRIGVAIAEKNLVAGYGIIENENPQAAIFEVAKIARKQNVERIIIGVPKNRNTLQMDKIQSFSKKLSLSLNLPISFVDETLTSKEAERILGKRIDPKTKKYKEEVDKLSAKIILEQYLETK